MYFGCQENYDSTITVANPSIYNSATMKAYRGHRLQKPQTCFAW